MWIAHAFIHVCWCSSVPSIAFKRDYAKVDVILAPSYNTLSSHHSDGSMAKMISLDDDDGELIRVVFMNPDGLHKVTICSMFV